MIVSEEMKKTMNQEHPELCGKWVTHCIRLPLSSLQADDQIAENRNNHRERLTLQLAKAEHIRRSILVSVRTIQLANMSVVRQQYRELMISALEMEQCSLSQPADIAGLSQPGLGHIFCAQVYGHQASGVGLKETSPSSAGAAWPATSRVMREDFETVSPFGGMTGIPGYSMR